MCIAHFFAFSRPLTFTIKYLNLTGAKSRDITNPDVVNKELTTKTTPINADELYQFDKITYNDFDIGPNPHLSYDKPEKLKNLEEANFEWEFTIPQNVKKFMRFWAKVPVEFQENGAGVKTIRRITHDKILDYSEYVEFKVPVVPTVPSWHYLDLCFR